ncbi:ubiquitin-conjugating enzyme E2 [archaeon]|nr:MAG: ubiquitin-conjugating enzyme E2 [archaeon]
MACLFLDIAELDGGRAAVVEFPNANDLTKFTVTVSPDSGFWSGAKFVFYFTIPALYPHEPPKVVCRTKIYHPNINLEGAVCLNILRDEWKPVLDINAVIYGLIYLFYEPNPDDPLNREAADLFRSDRAQFGRVVKRTLQGGSHAGEIFERLIS